MSWWRYWTPDPARANGLDVVYLPNVATPQAGDTWVESWDMAFKDTKTSDYVVGTRWVRRGPLRILLAQVRGQWAVTAARKGVVEGTRWWVDVELVDGRA